MAHTYTSLLFHIIFSTKRRYPFLGKQIEGETHSYICGVTRNLKMQMLAIDGTADHLHLLVKMPANLTVSEAVGKIKSNSSKWIHERFNDSGKFGWQTGYAAFSVSKSSAPGVAAYIRNQKQHHKARSFQEEFVEFLVKNEIEYDERYIWD